MLEKWTIVGEMDFKKSQSSDVTEYAPIAKALSTLDTSSEQRLKRKFEIAYLLCKQNLAALKFPLE